MMRVLHLVLRQEYVSNSAAKAALGVTVLGLLLAVAPNVAVAGSSSPVCSTHNPERNAYFGDLHVHTAISADAVAYDVIRAR
jgi:hypothetical protein